MIKKLIVTFEILSIIAAFVLTIWLVSDTKKKYSEMMMIKDEIADAETRLQALKAYEDRVDELKATLNSLETFRRNRLPVLPVLKEIVERSDPRTLIKIFEMEQDKVQIKGQGGSAIENMTRWVRIPFVKEGRFVSPVSHNSLVGDRFVAELIVDNTAANEYADKIAKGE